jgi:anthranilate synthase/aminodeoxychorismate synthase-like glutamine amidotransferase
MVLLIDNYDSFTYNLDGIRALHPSHIVISPGPGRPEDAGIAVAVIREFGARVPILGVCLGHQAIGLAFGGDVVRAPKPMHGKTSLVEHDGRGVFTGLTAALTAARYHSLVIAPDTMPATLEVSARVASEATIMGVRHRDWPVHGVQFHPESVMTGEGRRILRNFLEL